MPATRRTRAATKAAGTQPEAPPDMRHTAEPQYDGGAAEDSEDDERPKKKRRSASKAKLAGPAKQTKATKGAATKGAAAKGAAAKAKGRVVKGRGKLRLLLEMPLDVLFEIFKLLDPVDILHLSWAAKALRGILMQRSTYATTIWKQTFSNVLNVPACPGVSLPQFANLLCSRHCFYCLSVKSPTTPMWAFHVRSCTKCINLYFVGTSQFPRDSEREYARNSNLLRKHKLQSGFVYNSNEIEQVNSRLVDLPQGKERKEYIQARKKIVQDSEVLGTVGQTWASTIGLRQKQRIKEEEERRRRSIINRLVELGWGAEIALLNETDPDILADHELIRGHAELTERTWNRIIPLLQEFLQSTREKRLRKQRKAVLKQRQRILLGAFKDFVLSRPATEILPRAPDICNMDEIKVILDETPADEEVTLDTFADFLARLPQSCDEWRKSKSRYLLTLLPGADANPADDSADDFARLELATTYFKCYNCLEPIAYPRILAHSCMRELRIGYRNRDDGLALMFANVESVPWNFEGDRIQYHARAEAVAQDVVRSCGLDPGAATAQDMDEAGQWLECVRCEDHPKGRTVFRWNKAILHGLYHMVSDGKPNRWKRLNDKDAATAKKTEEKRSMDGSSGESDDYCCVRCREHHNLFGVRSHVRYSHSVQEPREERDYVMHADASMDQPPFPTIIAPPGGAAARKEAHGLIDLSADTESEPEGTADEASSHGSEEYCTDDDAL